MREIQIGDTVYAVDRAYLAGQRACRDGVPYWANPHRDGCTSHDQWNYGHENEGTE